MGAALNNADLCSLWYITTSETEVLMTFVLPTPKIVLPNGDTLPQRLVFVESAEKSSK